MRLSALDFWDLAQRTDVVRHNYPPSCLERDLGRSTHAHLGGRFFVYLARLARDGSGGVKLQVEDRGQKLSSASLQVS